MEPNESNAFVQKQPYPKVGIIILNWNSKADTLACLDSVELLAYPNYLVFMIDNGSTDGSVEMLREREAIGKLKLISNSENL